MMLLKSDSPLLVIQLALDFTHSELNIQIRDVTPALREQLQGADYVVSYCVKDFRGYEMAKALAQVGVENAVIIMKRARL